MCGLRSGRWVTVLRLVVENVSGFAVERPADGIERIESDATDFAGLQQRHVGQSDADFFGQLRERHFSLHQQQIQVHLDRHWSDHRFGVGPVLCTQAKNLCQQEYQERGKQQRPVHVISEQRQEPPRWDQLKEGLHTLVFEVPEEGAKKDAGERVDLEAGMAKLTFSRSAFKVTIPTTSQ